MSQKINILRVYLKYKNKKFSSKEKLVAYQKQKIAKQLKFVTTKSQFYKPYAGKELKDFPIIDKKIMMENFNILNTVNIDRDEALEFAISSEKSRSFSPTLKHITVGLSSGTSDTRGVFLVADSEKTTWAGYILSKVLYGSILDTYNVAFFMRANSNLYESVGSRNINFVFYDIYKPMEENRKKLMEQQPDIIVGQPSVLIDICDNCEGLRPKKVISIAEVLEDADAARIKKGFGVDVIHQVYQCTEGCLATTCEYGTIHLNEDIVYIEKEYIDEERFIPIITDFTRKSQPIIRYRLNDILVENRDNCPCGCKFTALKRIEGREDDVFIFSGVDGNAVKIYPDFIRRVMLFAGEVKDYRVVQQENGDLIVYFTGSDEMKDKIQSEFIKLSKDNKFLLPEIRFSDYQYDHNRKLKRVESQFIGGKR